MANSNFSIAGINEAVSRLNRIILETEGNTEDAIKDIALDLIGKSKERAPVDTGDLRGSGFVDIQGTSAIVGFTEIYALNQHEDLNFNHSDGEAKFLENPLKENIDNYIQHIRNGVTEAVT